jgi:hypothetical protein
LSWSSGCLENAGLTIYLRQSSHILYKDCLHFIALAN